MGEKNRRLALVKAQQGSGEIIVSLGQKRATRLAVLAYQKAGAEAAAKAAIAQYQAFDAAWNAEVKRVLEDDDVTVPDGATVNHDLDKGRIVVTPNKDEPVDLPPETEPA